MRLSHATISALLLILVACDDGDGEVRDALADQDRAIDASPQDSAPLDDARLDDAEGVDLGADAQPLDAQPLDAQPADAQPLDAQPADAQPADAQPLDARLIDAQPADAQPLDARLIDAQPIDAQPIDAQPIDAWPLDATLVDATFTDAAAPEGCLSVDRLQLTTLPPQGLQLLFRLLDCEGAPVRPLTLEDLDLLDASGAPLAPPAHLQALTAPLRVLLVLDLSQGAFDAGAAGEIIDAAEGFVAQRLRDGGDVEIAVAASGRLDAFEVFSDFSGDAAGLLAALEMLREGPPRGASELYGAYVRALAHLDAHVEGTPEAETAMLLFVAAPPTDAQSRRAAVNQARATTPSRVYAVGARGAWDEALVEALVTPGAEAIWVGAPSLLGGPTRAISAALEAARRSHYALGLCGVAAGAPSLRFSVEAASTTLPLVIPPGLDEATGCDPARLAAGFICDPDAVGCEGAIARRCDALGREEVLIDCAATPGQICLEGACVAPECEDDARRPCGASDVGACVMGEAICVGRRWGPCVGAVMPEAERCDGVDNDCDEAIDEDQGVLRCGVGACEVITEACLAGALAVCTPAAPGVEIPDNQIDDDCDGEVDEIGYGVIEGRVVTCPKLEDTTPASAVAEAVATQAAQAARAPLRPGQLIALLRPEAAPLKAEAILAQLQRHTPTRLRWRHRVGARIVSLGVDVDGLDRATAAARTWAAAAALRGAKLIEAVSPEALSQPMRTPNDPLYPLQRWHYELIQLPDAWALERGAATTRVAVLDTGIMEGHPDLEGQLIPGYDFASEGFDGDNGWDDDPHDAVSDSYLCDDWSHPDCPHYHGTHVAGTVGAVGDNASHGAGVAWHAALQPVRVLGYQGGTYADIFSGMRWAVGLAVDGAPINRSPSRILNMSLGGACRPEGCEAFGCDDYCAQITRLYEVVADEVLGTGALVVVAAGNNDQPAVDYLPSKISRFLTVGAVRPDARRASYSNYGASVDVMAPGGAGWYEGNDEDRVWSLSDAAGFEALPGTSMAAPHVAGLAALLLSAEPTLDGVGLASLISETAGPVGRCNEGCGEGLINAYAALSQIVTPGAAGTLKLASRYLDFGSAQTQVKLWFWNTGDGPLDWTAWPDTAGYVSERVALQPSSGRLEPGAWGALDVVVLRYGLEEGRYGSFVIIEAGGGGGVVPLAFRVGEPCLEIGRVNVSARQYDAEGVLRVVATDTAFAGGDFAYTLEGIPAGLPTLIDAEVNPAGPLEVGDYIGRWPFLSAPQPITVQPEMRRGGVDINLTPYAPEGLPGFPGAPCASDADCEGIEQGVCLAFDTIPGGYCARWCAEDRWCPIGAACVDFQSGEAYCLASCEGDAGCRVQDNQECWPFYLGLDLCLWPTAIPGRVPVGLGCEADTDCRDADGGICLQDQAGGYCSLSCQSDEGCPKGAACVDLGDEDGYCLDICESREGCRRPTHACYAFGDAGVCWSMALGEACEDEAGCGAQMVCADGACQLPCDEDGACARGECGLFGVCE
ncbi:S8 family serine peptidase [Myxococcota bacterium]|nr:S8 family serine peptidase [Myxococcota bacterium]MBU1897794.1 S8 family serine peptidase [Myxococcota bacterium]